MSRPIEPARVNALIAGDKTYFTGKPCKYGHIGARSVINGTCVKCSRDKSKGQTYEQRATKRAYDKTPEAKAAKALRRARPDQQEATRAYSERTKDRKKAHAETLPGRARRLFNKATYRAQSLGVGCDLTYEFVLAKLTERYALGDISLESDRPDTASLDQRVAGLGYLQDNIQVVPWWYNAAKNRFTTEELTAAIESWQKAAQIV